MLWLWKKGHIKRDSPYWEEKDFERAKDSGTHNVSGIVWRRAAQETFMEVDIDSKKHRRLLDTGCEHSIIPHKFVPNVELVPVDIDVFAANSAKIDILGCIKLKFSVSGIPLTAVILLPNGESEFMLGIDWLVEQDIEWSFGTNTINL